ncbi:aminotransferase class I/II-fold pyridoxal phosphate-dependent enzyme [Neorhizobium sp. P12A]|nr:aminotransferase class I/II-fold pyridoxal phosphate-dependent enzyme [Neorhizobium sp. P12A]
MTAKKTSHIPRPDPATETPYYRQIYDRFRSAIAEGVLKPSDRIQSARALAKELGLARGTIETAYSLLAAEGYIQARGQAGSIISPDLTPGTAEPMPIRPVGSDPLVTSYRPDTILPFQMDLPALDAFPRKIWARLGARRVRAMQPSDMMHPDIEGLPELRAQIAGYLRVSRGIDCSPRQVFVTSGYRQTIGMISHALLKAGDRVWLEDPGYPRNYTGHIRVSLNDGSVVELRQPHFRGGVREPLTRDELIAKFHGNVAYGAASPQYGQSLLDFCLNLQTESDVSALAELEA